MMATDEINVIQAQDSAVRVILPFRLLGRMEEVRAALGPAEAQDAADPALADWRIGRVVDSGGLSIAKKKMSNAGE